MRVDADLTFPRRQFLIRRYFLQAMLSPISFLPAPPPRPLAYPSLAFGCLLFVLRPSNNNFENYPQNPSPFLTPFYRPKGIPPISPSLRCTRRYVADQRNRERGW